MIPVLILIQFGKAFQRTGKCVRVSHSDVTRRVKAARTKRSILTAHDHRRKQRANSYGSKSQKDERRESRNLGRIEKKEERENTGTERNKYTNWICMSSNL